MRKAFLAVAGVTSVVAQVAAQGTGAIPPKVVDDPSPYLQPSSDEGWILKYIRLQRRYHQSIVAGFDAAFPSCTDRPEFLRYLEIWTGQNGVSIEFDSLESNVKTRFMIAPDGTKWVGVVELPSCAIEFDLRKLSFEYGRWREIRPVPPSAIHDWGERESKIGLPGQLRPGRMSFTFPRDPDCPKSSGVGGLRQHSIVADLSMKFGIWVERRNESPYSNDDTIAHGTCRYDLSILLYTKDGQGSFHPVPVSPIFSAFRGPR